MILEVCILLSESAMSQFLIFFVLLFKSGEIKINLLTLVLHKDMFYLHCYTHFTQMTVTPSLLSGLSMI